MEKLARILLGKLSISTAIATSVLMAGVLGGAVYVFASATSNFTQAINPGTLSVDIVNGSYSHVVSPSVAMSPLTFSFGTQISTGVLGTTSQQIYVQNPDAADNGWAVSIAASDPTDVWASAGTPFDYNDSSGSGYTDGGDGDSVGGQMTINPAAGTLSTGACAACVSTNVTKGSSASFVEGTTTSITVLTGASNSDDIGDWKLNGVSVSQKSPAEQPAATDYNINMVLTIAAS